MNRVLAAPTGRAANRLTDELQHAYAITVHRSQGSEYPGVVMPLTMSSYTLLQRNLL